MAVSGVPERIVLKNATGMTLSDRFGIIQKKPISQTVTFRMAEQNRASAKKRRLAQQMARRPDIHWSAIDTPPVVPYVELVEEPNSNRSIANRLGSPAQTIQGRLGTPINRRGRGARQWHQARAQIVYINENGYTTPQPQVLMRGSSRGAYRRGGRGLSRGLSHFVPLTTGFQYTGQNFRGNAGRGGVGRGAIRGTWLASGRGSRSQSSFRGQRGKGQLQTGGQQQAGGQQRPAVGSGQKHQAVTRQQLDHQLDQYMANA